MLPLPGTPLFLILFEMQVACPRCEGRTKGLLTGYEAVLEEFERVKRTPTRRSPKLRRRDSLITPFPPL